jgi:hypothetical protein
MPDEFGFLPSPSGRLLLVWEESSRTDRYGLPMEARWTVVTLADGNAVRLATTHGRIALLPHWLSDTELVLMGEGGAETRIAVGAPGPLALPPISRDGGQKARDEYRRRYCQTEHDELLSALQKSEDELGLRGFHELMDERRWQWAVSDMVLWPLGMPRLDTLWIYGYRRPQASFSPDGTLLALADAWTEAPAVEVWHGDEKVTIHTSGARLVVYRAATGQRVWAQMTPPKPRRLPENGPRVNPSPMPWVTAPYRDPRWSPDGRYLSFTKYDYPGVPEVNVVEVSTWEQVVRIPRAADAFIVPVGGHKRGQ